MIDKNKYFKVNGSDDCFKKIKASHIDFAVCGFMAKSRQGRIDADKAIGCLAMLSIGRIFTRHGVKKLSYDLLSRCFEEIKENCDSANTQENIDQFESIVTKYIEEGLEEKIYS
jgi:hypothetical protein